MIVEFTLSCKQKKEQKGPGPEVLNQLESFPEDYLHLISQNHVTGVTLICKEGWEM